MADTPKFELDAARMKRGMATSPNQYRKMYSDTGPAAPTAAKPHARDTQIDAAERKALGPDGTYSEPGNSGSSTGQ